MGVLWKRAKLEQAKVYYFDTLPPLLKTSVLTLAQPDQIRSSFAKQVNDLSSFRQFSTFNQFDP